MQLTEIDHIAIAVTDLDAAIAYYQDTFGCTVDHRELIESDGVEEALLKVADSYVQLLTPRATRRRWRSTSRPRAKGFTTWGTASPTAARRSTRVKAAGHRVIDEAPRPGSRGTTVAFVHPKGAFGTLIELVQE